MKMMQILILAVLFVSCATAAPKELIVARAAYQDASDSAAAQLVPAELHKAHEALVRAENSFKKNSNSFKTRDLAYVAGRKSELAMVLGGIAVDNADKATAEAEFLTQQSRLLEQGRQDLSDSRQRTADALAALSSLAAAREEERGLVITLSGSVLFLSGKSALLPGAAVKLDEVSRALMEVRDRNLIVEGHTDSHGTPEYNQGLSQERAESVRNYLVSGGFPGDHIQALGMGEGNPIADNESPEGRANNRRVEIIVEGDMHTTNP